jgi:hypothetical protein
MAIGSGLHGSWLWQSQLASINLDCHLGKFRLAANLGATAIKESNLLVIGRQDSKQVGSAPVQPQLMADHTKDDAQKNQIGDVHLASLQQHERKDHPGRGDRIETSRVHDA